LPNEGTPVGEDIFERALERDDIVRRRRIISSMSAARVVDFPTVGPEMMTKPSRINQPAQVRV